MQVSSGLAPPAQKCMPDKHRKAGYRPDGSAVETVMIRCMSGEGVFKRQKRTSMACQDMQ